MSHWEHLNESREYICGLIQVDIAGHSEWKGAKVFQKQTKENLRKYLKSFAEPYLDIHELHWAGDGGSYLIPILEPEKDYDSLVYCAIHFLYSLDLFNRLPIFNRLGFPITIRISCHEGRIHYSSDYGNLHGQALNYFFKYEREIGSENTVTITEEIYQNLTDHDLKEQFVEIESHEYKVGNQRYSNQLYRYTYNHEPLHKEAEIPEQTDTALETMSQWSHSQVCGTYAVEGKNPRTQLSYSGELQIKERGEGLLGTWEIGTRGIDASKQSDEGIGLLVGNAIAFSYKHTDPKDPYTGVLLYEIMSDDIMRGHWTVFGESHLGFEECRKKKPDE